MTLETSFSLGQTRKVVFLHKGFWLNSEVTEIFENKWGVGGDFIFRSNNEMNQGSIFKRWHRFSLRPWVHYRFSPHLRVSFSPVGYFITNEYIGKKADYNRQPYDELRTTFQVSHQYKMMGERFTHTFRHRFEIRYRRPFEKENFFIFTRYGLQYRLSFLINKPYYWQKNVWYTYISNDIMINYGSRVVYNMFSQNRTQVALGFRFHRSSRIELGYMNRFRSRSSGFEYDNTEALHLGIFIDQFSSLFGKDVKPVKFSD
jgi:hypothetical protein